MLKDKQHQQWQKQQFVETEQASEPDSDMVGMLELSDSELRTAMINIRRAITDKVDATQDQMGNVSRARNYFFKVFI